MFGFGKKAKPEEGFKELPEVRDLMKDLLAETMDLYVGTTVGYLMNLGKTEKDVEKAREDMISALQKYVQTEILLERQRHGQAPSLEELVFLRTK